MKYSNWIGIVAALLLIAACFFPWTYYPDLNKTFSGFFSEGNKYGRPGKVFIFFAIIAIVLFVTPRIWAKRLNMLITVLALAFAIRSFVLFTSCYQGICPEKRAGIFIVLIAPFIMLLASVLPDLKLKEEIK
jgi:amino acid permease